MATNENLIPIPGRLHSVATEGHVAGANEIYDDTLQKDQATLNSESAYIDDSESSPAVVPGFDPTTDTVHVTAQTLSETQKAQVRTNIGLNDVDARINEAVAYRIPTSQKGVAGGVASLDNSGKVPSEQLPSYVDDVINGYYYNGSFYKEAAHTTVITGDGGNIYFDITTDKSYRWSGSAYILISNPYSVDEEDLTVVNNNIKFKDRPNTSGMGRVILRKNMVSGVNTITQSMINQANTIYVIQYDFILGEDITVPANCVLEFEGGSINRGTIVNNETEYIGNVKMWNIVFSGTIKNYEIDIRWFESVSNIADNFIPTYANAVAYINQANKAHKLNIPNNVYNCHPLIYQNEEEYHLRFITELVDVNDIIIAGNGSTLNFVDSMPNSIGHNKGLDEGIISFRATEEGACSNIVVEGLIIIANNTYVYEDSDGHSFGIIFRAVHNGTISNCTCDYWGTDGIAISKAYSNQFWSRDCQIINSSCGYNQRQGISLTGVFENCLIENCHLHHTDGGSFRNGIDIETNNSSDIQKHITIRGCYFDNNNNADICLIRCTDITIINNFFYDSVSYRCIWLNYDNKDIVIEGNTFNPKECAIYSNGALNRCVIAGNISKKNENSTGYAHGSFVVLAEGGQKNISVIGNIADGGIINLTLASEKTIESLFVANNKFVGKAIYLSVTCSDAVYKGNLFNINAGSEDSGLSVELKVNQSFNENILYTNKISLLMFNSTKPVCDNSFIYTGTDTYNCQFASPSINNYVNTNKLVIQKDGVNISSGGVNIGLVYTNPNIITKGSYQANIGIVPGGKQRYDNTTVSDNDVIGSMIVDYNPTCILLKGGNGYELIADSLHTSDEYPALNIKGRKRYSPTYNDFRVHNGSKYIPTSKLPANNTTNRFTELDESDAGLSYFDKTLGKPIYWNGSAWVDATGTPV